MSISVVVRAAARRPIMVSANSANMKRIFTFLAGRARVLTLHGTALMTSACGPTFASTPNHSERQTIGFQQNEDRTKQDLCLIQPFPSLYIFPSFQVGTHADIFYSLRFTSACFATIGWLHHEERLVSRNGFEEKREHVLVDFE